MSSKFSQSKYKIDRRFGVNIWGRKKSPVNVRDYGPGQHGQRRSGKASDFKLQLSAKQKVRGHYALREKQFRRLFEEAYRKKGDTSENFIGLLESRLDAVVYRMKFAATIFAAKQLVSHGHVKVNDRRVNIGSYRVQPGDVITLGAKAHTMAVVAESLQSDERDCPGYIKVESDKFLGTFVRKPEISAVPYAFKIEPQLVTEWYSRRI